ncbi:DUF5916 domain-containing protein [Mangrovimonas spongiae]|uniref:Protein with DOMON-like ligand-binding domain protein n=1 Tax=Mangrovimonas spongiae TaxID=2494697 RepID=A0A3R9URN7_9FLAO|nr:DUF5916 domain-containing protein [Mangrovimonas spongiae]RSK38724.1 protein with DOMON-like ligand-binding domain protein [Mangrovimonas spongiae]
MRLVTVFIYFFIICISIQAQEKKHLNIKRTTTPPKIDGVIDDKAWKDAQEATNFIQFKPDVGNTLPSHQKTSVKATYDDDAIYFAAFLHDKPKDIMKQFNQRDNFGQQDFFGIILNPNNDAQNDTEFFVFPSGNQADALASPSIGEDFGWNAVWESAVKIVSNGWVIEVKIPYRCLRFSNKEVQTWGIQFHRHFRTDRSQYTWNPIDPTKGNIGLYHGELTGIKNIQPPTRLSFYPFASGLYTTQDGNSEDKFTLGLDLKYGISENFTLDATLIPDFSQAGFDDVQLNLGPFEQTFAEQRQFFTEGVDLFNKGGLFYSRRVGSAPVGRPNLSSDEEITDYPSKVKVLNAIKVSGRTKNGLGIGFFNAITEKTNAKIKNTVTGETRNEVVEPLTNYNIFVVDQQFNGNSSVSLINTNVTRNGHFRDANVTGVLADITNKSNTINVTGQLKTSNVNTPNGMSTGFSSELGLRKINGNYRYGIYHNLANDDYDINDLGVIFRNNYNNFSADVSYRIFEPTTTFNTFNANLWIDYSRLLKPSTYTGTNIGSSFNATNKKLHSFGASASFEPGKQYDYFEPRTEGYHFIYENKYNVNTWISSNYNNTFALDTSLGAAEILENNRDAFNYWYSISPRIKFSEKFILVYSYEFDNYNGDRGFVTKQDNHIIFGQRDRRTVVNSLSGNYNFNAVNALTLTFRNYWSTVTYHDNLYTLQENGRLSQEEAFTTTDISNPDVNFNTWNLDLSYTWQFAPGSLLSALYRNQLFENSNEASKAYFESLDTLFQQPIQHTFSLRLVYFIDFNTIKNKFKKKA